MTREIATRAIVFHYQQHTDMIIIITHEFHGDTSLESLKQNFRAAVSVTY